jgi:hypothetical protein
LTKGSENVLPPWIYEKENLPLCTSFQSSGSISHETSFALYFLFCFLYFLRNEAPRGVVVKW